jgi:hypothetical protein
VDWLGFFASAIRSLAWPAAIVLVVVILRAPFRDLVPNLKELRFPGGEAKFFKRQLAIVEEEAREAGVEQVERAADDAITDLPVSVNAAQLDQLTEVSPPAAVVSAWILVERAAEDAARRLGLPEGRRNPMQLFRELDAIGATPRLEPIAGELRSLRNRAAHPSDEVIDANTARSYVDVALGVVQTLNNASRPTVPGAG